MIEFLQKQLFDIDYFNWWLVAAYVLLVSIFLYGILQPRRKAEWKSAGVAQAWIIALYAEMYGTPLTAYFMMNLLGRTTEDAEKHFNGHMWPIVFGIGENNLVVAQFITVLIGQFLVVAGALLAIIGWRKLYKAVSKGEMATSGVYRYIRHPQYTGFYLFLFGSVINWPTIATLFTLPILCFVYFRLANFEELESIQRFGDRYREYAKCTGKFLPRFKLGFGRV